MKTKTIRFEKGGFIFGPIKLFLELPNDGILLSTRGTLSMSGVKYEILKSFTVQINIIEDEES